MSFAFSGSRAGGYLAMRRPSTPKPSRCSASVGDAGVDKPLPGSDMIVRDLGRGVDTSSRVQRRSDRLAGRRPWPSARHDRPSLRVTRGRAIQLYDPDDGRAPRPRTSSSAFYTGLAWREGFPGRPRCAPLKWVSSDFEEETQIVLAWKGLAAVKPEAKSLADPYQFARLPGGGPEIVS